MQNKACNFSTCVIQLITWLGEESHNLGIKITDLLIPSLSYVTINKYVNLDIVMSNQQLLISK